MTIEHEIAKQICAEFAGAEMCKFALIQKADGKNITLIYTGLLFDEQEAEQRINTRLAGSSFIIKAQRMNRMRFGIFVTSQQVHWYWIRKQPNVVFIASKFVF